MTRDTLLRRYLKERNIPLDSLEANSIIEGIEWADAHSINPWHKSPEELPKETGKVLICNDNGRGEAIFLQVAMYTIEDNGEGHFIECHYCDKVEPDYWMEIPELPKED